MDGSSPQTTAQALRIARSLIEAGVPIFTAPPCPAGAGAGGTCNRPGHAGGAVEYDLPARWQLTTPDLAVLDAWRPGWALAAVGGHAADFLDEDPRNGGKESVDQLKLVGQWPTVYGVAATPSGGFHYLISPIGQRKVTGLMPGLDYQGGEGGPGGSGKGHGFVWLAPTVKRSKTDGMRRAYTWVQEPDLDWLSEFGRDAGVSTDGSVDGLRLRIGAYRLRRAEKIEKLRANVNSTARTFTRAQMDTFLAPALERLASARVGEIEERANDAACLLSHFVPGMLTAEAAYDVLTDALGETAYDPLHPASGWTADKFVAVIADVGGRAPGDWHAVFIPDTPAEAAAVVTEDDAYKLYLETLGPDELAARQPPRYMIENLLQYDSESWLIGEPGAKKSFVALDIAGHVARGMPWQGLRVNAGRVVFIVAEGAGGSSLRMRAWQQAYGPMGVKPDVCFLPRPVQAKTLKDWAVLVRMCTLLAEQGTAQGKGMLIVLDTQARMTVGLEENSATDMGVFIDAVRALREATGACVLTVHHTGRRGGDARGSSAIDGAQTTELKVKASAGSDGGLYGEVITEKQKDMEQLPPIKIKFSRVDLGTGEDGRPVTSLTLLPADAWSAAEFDGESASASARARDDAYACPEPQPWTFVAFDNPNQFLSRRILQMLREVAGESGLTRADLKTAVVERWYPKGIGRKAGQLSDNKTDQGWLKALGECEQARTASGQRIMINPGASSARFAVSLDALAELGGLNIDED